MKFVCVRFCSCAYKRLSTSRKEVNTAIYMEEIWWSGSKRCKKCKHCKSDTGFLDVVLTFLG